MKGAGRKAVWYVNFRMCMYLPILPYLPTSYLSSLSMSFSLTRSRFFFFFLPDLRQRDMEHSSFSLSAGFDALDSGPYVSTFHVCLISDHSPQNPALPSIPKELNIKRKAILTARSPSTQQTKLS